MYMFEGRSFFFKSQCFIPWLINVAKIITYKMCFILASFEIYSLDNLAADDS
jgi:hypothetical protein